MLLESLWGIQVWAGRGSRAMTLHSSDKLPQVSPGITQSCSPFEVGMTPYLGNFVLYLR